MKSFQQFQEELKDKFTNTTSAMNNIFSGQGLGQLQQKVRSGEFNIKDIKDFAKSKEANEIPLKFLQGLLKDGSKIIDQKTNKVNTLLKNK